MDIERAKELLPIIQAYAEGKAIESRCIKGDKSLWYDDEDPSFDNDLEYRIKPEPKYRPFKDAEECWEEMLKHQRFGWIYNGSYYYSIVSISNETINIVDDTRDTVDFLLSEILEEDYTFADGVPFGVKVEE